MPYLQKGSQAMNASPEVTSPESAVRPGYDHLPEELRHYLFCEPRGLAPLRFHALPLPPNTSNPLKLWGGVYELAPHGLTARAFCPDQVWAEHLAALLNDSAPQIR